MSKITKAIAALGVVAGLGVAALPLSTYAATTASKQATVQVEVGGTISMELAVPKAETTVSDGASFNVATATLDLGSVKLGGAPTTGAIGVVVKSNDPTGYVLSIAPLNTASTAMTGAASTTIPADAPAQNKTAWGFKLSGDTEWKSFKETSSVELKNDGNITVTGDEGEGSEQTDVIFGVSADTDLKEGTYSTNVVFTATVK